MNNLENDKFAQQIKSVLDESIKDIDADTQYQLQMARAKVLEKSNIPRWYQRWTIWATISGVTVMSVLAILLLYINPNYQSQNLEIIASIENTVTEEDVYMEFYEEYDFYVWLSEQDALKHKRGMN